jgi:hypothetical protein
MPERAYVVQVRAVLQPPWLHGAPWERANIRTFASQVGLRGRSRLSTAGLAEALCAHAASVPPDRAGRSLPSSRLRQPWAQWWREALLHRAHPDHFPSPTSAGFVELDLHPQQPVYWLPSPSPTVIERRLAVNTLRGLLPSGALDDAIRARTRRSWNQIIPQAMLWELAISHIRARSFKLRMMLPAEYTDGLEPENEHALSLSLRCEPRAAHRMGQ